jgi:Arc/MetJ-type ribon-helix-helix transcriptional regulator
MAAGMRERLSIRITKRYMQCLDRLVAAGVYTSRNAAIRDALRMLFEHYGFKLLENEDNPSHPGPRRSGSRSA